ncbi:MAG: hypothetical protein GY807_01840 [Gammaproteobacteria bacterium]|nr:hypothetical protein [Gammaproteobacteria bacterium]
MNTSETQTQREVDTAWGLWNSLNERAEALWQRYEAPFIDIIMEERRIEMMGPPPEIDDDIDDDIDIEEDIPF